MRMEGKLSRRCQIQPIVTLYKTAVITIFITLLMNAHKGHLPKFRNTVT